MVTPTTGRFVMHTASGNRPATKEFEASDVAEERLTFPDLDDDAFFTVPDEDGAWIVDDVQFDDDADATNRVRVKKGSQEMDLFISRKQAATAQTPEGRGQGLVGRRFTPGNRYAFIQR